MHLAPTQQTTIHLCTTVSGKNTVWTALIVSRDWPGRFISDAGIPTARALSHLRV